MNESVDIVIVGSGPAGAAIAETLLNRNDPPSIIMLEAGPSIKMENQRKWWDFVLRNELPYTKCEDAKSDYDDLAELESNKGGTSMTLKGSRLFARGGSSLHWGAWMPRFKPEDFKLKTSAGVGMDWPQSINYDTIKPYYVKAEKFLQVAGDSNDIVPDQYPFKAPPFSVSDGVVIKALEMLQYSYMHIPVCRNEKPINGQKKCETIGTCKYCPIGARYSSDQTLDRLEKNHPNKFEFRTGAAVRRIVMSGKKTAAEVELFNIKSKQIEQIGINKQVIIAAGAIESPKILLASHEKQHWSLGLGNDSGHLGRHIIAHPLIAATGVRPQNTEKAFNEINFPTLGTRQFDSVQEQPKGKMLIVREHSAPTIPFQEMMLKGQPLATLQDTLNGQQVFELRGFVEEFAHPRSRLGLARGSTRFGTYRTEMEFYQNIITTEAMNKHLKHLEGILEKMGCVSISASPFPRRADHLMSACRMTDNARDGVVDDNLRVHGTDNVYVCSNAVFPSGAAANPSLTLVALAIRLGEHL